MGSKILETLGFDSRDISRIANSSNNNKISNESIPNFVLGTIINNIKSTYVNTPIFNLKNLANDGLIELNENSASEDYMSILMTSNKKATSESNVFTIDAKIGGIFGASVSAHYDQSMSKANSDGEIYVAMKRGKYGSYYEIHSEDLLAGLDFTPYLIGTELTTLEIEKYLRVEQDSSKRKKYIKKLDFGGFENSGLIPWDQRNIYGNIQLITGMEKIFTILLEQYATFKDNKKIKDILYTNMVELKYKKIGHAVKDFYAHVGTHFVFKLNFSNYAYGYGTLHFSESSSEKNLGAAFSIGGGIKAVWDASLEVSYAQKKGWANAMKNLKIDASCKPSGVCDIKNFATDIMKALEDEGGNLSVPSLDIPKPPKVEILIAPVRKKESVSPPDSVFSSYKEWKDYRDDIKKDDKGKDKIAEAINKAEEDLRKGYEKPSALNSNEQSNDKISNNRHLYEAFKQEINELKTYRKQNEKESADNDSDILRIENMFVSGYDVESYESVIPSLRTNKLILPKIKDDIDSYPNVSRVFLLSNMFRQLADYIRFISKFSVSNIGNKGNSPDIFVSKIYTFFDEFSEGGYNLITNCMALGKDIPNELLADYECNMYFNENSKLSEILGDTDKVKYIKYLLRHDVMYLWRDAPGGYATFYVDKNQDIFFVTPRGINGDRGEEIKYVHAYTEFYLSKRITETPEDMFQLYKDSSVSPLYPIFRYESKNNPKLVFLQLIGRYQLIYGSNAQIKPRFYETTGFLPFSLQENVLANNWLNTDFFPDIDYSITDTLMPYVEGFNIDKFNQDYALYFLNKEQSKDLRKKNRVVQICDHLNVDETQKTVLSEEKIKIINSFVLHTSYIVENLYYSCIHHSEGPVGYLVDIESGRSKELSDPGKFPLLMPIDYLKIETKTEDKVKGKSCCLLMGNSFGAENIIVSSTYDAAVIASILTRS